MVSIDVITSKRTAMKATLVSVSLIAATTAFTLPTCPIHHHLPTHAAIPATRTPTPCRQGRLSPLSFQWKDTVFAEETDAAETDARDDSKNAVLATVDEEAVAARAAVVTPAVVVAEEEEGAGSLTGDGLFWRGVVVVLCALWASNFACAKLVMSQPGVDSSLYAVARFSLAALSLAPGSINAVRKGSISWDTARGAFVCGSWVAFGYLGQLIGLMSTTPSRACVICSLNCIFVAIVAELARVNSAKDRGYASNFDLKTLVPALIAVAGVAIIELKGAAGDPTVGDLICFAQPIGFGMGYLQLEELMKKQPEAALPVSAIKLAVVTTAALIFFEASPHAAADLAGGAADAAASAGGALAEGTGGWSPTIPDFTPITSSPTALAAIFYTGLITTSAALYVESIAFARVPATDASIILTTEPLFAAAVSALLVGETFGASDAIGAFFIVGACIYAIKMGDAEEYCDDNTKECVVEDPFE